MPRANAQRRRTHLHRQGRAHNAPVPGRLLECGMSHGGARLKHQPALEVLGWECRMTNQCRNPNDEVMSSGWHSAIRAGCMAVLAAVGVSAAEVDLSRLPPAATNIISFDQHVRAILDRSCVRCHGPERPKSGYRLDNRESALKGGDNGVAIAPGKSAKSPLIHYVAGLVVDMEMPPKGKGDPLTTEEIALLR